jgi:hypothetical protein
MLQRMRAVTRAARVNRDCQSCQLWSLGIRARALRSSCWSKSSPTFASRSKPLSPMPSWHSFRCYVRWPQWRLKGLSRSAPAGLPLRTVALRTPMSCQECLSPRLEGCLLKSSNVCFPSFIWFAWELFSLSLGIGRHCALPSCGLCLEPTTR